MKGRRILISVLVLLLTLAVGLSQADTPTPALPLAGGGLGGGGPLGTAASALRRDSGQAPLSTSFTYQGQLRQGGSPVNGTCDLQFSLWDAASGGAQIGTTQTATSVTVSNGLFTVQLDFGSAAFTGDARWLEIAVRCPAGSGSYTTLTPRQALTATPYALYAQAIPLAGSGSATAAARSDHDHFAQNWSGETPVGGSGLRVNNTSTTGGYGLYGETASDLTGANGYAGVHGESTASVDGYGVVGVTQSSSVGAGVGGFANQGDAAGVRGVTYSDADGAAAVVGHVTSTSPGGYSAGVRGINEGTGVNGIGVYGSQNGSGWGVYGTSVDGTGVLGEATGTTGYGVGVQGVNYSEADGAAAVVGRVTSTSPGGSSAGVRGINEGTGGSGIGVWGSQNGSGWGVYGTSVDGRGVYGAATGTTGYGVYGTSVDGIGVLGEATGTTGDGVGVYGETSSNAVGATAVVGRVASTEPGGYSAGVHGINEGTGGNGIGVWGSHNGSGWGVHGTSVSGWGVYGYATDGTGVVGWSATGNPLEAWSSTDGGDRRFYVSNSGEVYADGSFNPGGADFAEMLPAGSGLEPGDVLVVGPDGKLARSTEPYQASVVGVYSSLPGFLGGAGDGVDLTGKVPLAVMGVVSVKVSAENGAIQPGDLLTTSSIPGHAMKATPVLINGVPFYRNGVIIGKALGSLKSGTGAMQMLVMLQ